MKIRKLLDALSVSQVGEGARDMRGGGWERKSHVRGVGGRLEPTNTSHRLPSHLSARSPSTSLSCTPGGSTDGWYREGDRIGRQTPQRAKSNYQCRQ